MRAVAQALRWNPLPVVIPRHRVIGVTGALVRYPGGETWRKRELLAVEGVPLAPLWARKHPRKGSHDYQIRRDVMYVRQAGETEYCLPTCSSTDQFPLGAELFGSRARAEAAGFVPCTSCRPDLHPLAS